MRILLIYKTNITAEQYKKCITTTKELSAFTRTYKLYLICDILEKKTSGYTMVVHGRPKTPKNTSFLGVTQPPGVAEPLYSMGHN